MGKTLYDYCIEGNRLDILIQWDTEKNGNLTPKDVSYGSKKKVWWQCEEGHIWNAVIYSRTGKTKCGCPECARKKPRPVSTRKKPCPPPIPRTLEGEFPNIAKQWHPTKNGSLTPAQVMSGSHRKVWWMCEKGHEWEIAVKVRTQGGGCPICANKVVIAGDNDLATTHPEIAKQWHPERNGTLIPQQVAAGSSTKAWWICEKGHEYFACINSRTRAVGSGCPICAGRQILPGYNDLASTFPDIADQWHPTKNGKLTPQNVSPNSNRQVWWICEKGHAYHTYISHRTRKKVGCSYCANRKVLAGFNDLATVYPKIAKQWHPELNGELTPQMVVSGSSKRVWWQCEEGHVWQTVIYSRTGPNKTGCPFCSGKYSAERQKQYNQVIQEQKSKTR